MVQRPRRGLSNTNERGTSRVPGCVGLTLPSSGQSKGCALRLPLMSNVSQRKCKCPHCHALLASSGCSPLIVAKAGCRSPRLEVRGGLSALCRPAHVRWVIGRVNAALGHASCTLQANQYRHRPSKWPFAEARGPWRAVRALPASARPVFHRPNQYCAWLHRSSLFARLRRVAFSERECRGTSQRLLSLAPSRRLGAL